MKAADVNAPFAQSCAHTADNTGHVLITHYQHVSLRDRLNMKSVQFSDSTLARLIAISEKCSGETLLAGVRSNMSTNRGNRFRSRTKVGCVDCDAALLCYQKGIHGIHSSADVS